MSKKPEKKMSLTARFNELGAGLVAQTTNPTILGAAFLMGACARPFDENIAFTIWSAPMIFYGTCFVLQKSAALLGHDQGPHGPR